MRMIPSTPLRTKSSAEPRVFDMLRSTFNDASHSGWFAMHSLNLPRHEYKRFGEIDFIICGPDGLFVIEVKGGGVSCRDGVWASTNRYGETERMKESPFKQADGALHGLLGKLAEILPGTVLAQLAVGYGVITPDCDLPKEGAEWDTAVLAGARACRDFERWFRGLIRHWRSKDGRNVEATADALRTVCQALRPEFEAAIPLHLAAHDVESRVATLTEDQLYFVDVVEANPRVICSGGAGTGKTFLAMELARRWTESGKNVVLACFSPWLKSYLASKFDMPGLTITLADSISVAARRANLAQFDALIVDEGQDLLNLDSLGGLDAMLAGGLGQGQWCFFHDVNNQSGLCGNYTPDAYEYLESLQHQKVPLRKNCRNALPILEKIRTSLAADLGVAGVGAGPAVREFKVADRQQAAQKLAEELCDLVDREGLNAGDIAVLSPLPFSESCASLLAPNFQRRLMILDEFAPQSLAHTCASFARIADFKGLESEAVILIDVPRAGTDSDYKALQYVGMSRARAVLSMICTCPENSKLN